MRARLLLLASVCLLLPFAHASAAPRDTLVVSPAWLASHIKDKDLVLLHVGDQAEYDAGHLPGARFAALSAISTSDRSPTGLTLEMPPAEDLRQRLEALGISDTSRIVVYFGKDWVSPSTRILFTLDHAGLGDRTALLDGGMAQWVKAGHSVTVEVPPAAKGTLSPLKLKPIVVDAAFVAAHVKSPGFAVVDGRSASFYDGVQVGGGQQQPHRAGHIAGAHSVPFTEITSDDLQLRPATELAAIFAKAGVQPGDTVIGYCHIGQQATAMLFAARTLGHPVLLYDGSFEDWSRRTELPVENPAAKDRQ